MARHQSFPWRMTLHFFAAAVTNPGLHDLYAHQCSVDRRHAFTNVISLILDTGASISVSNCSADFVTTIRPVQIQGLGTVRYTVSDDTGSPITIIIPEVLYEPDCPSCLLCPRQLLSSVGDPTVTMNIRSHGVQLLFHKHSITIPYHGSSYLPILYAVPSLACYHNFCAPSKSSESPHQGSHTPTTEHHSCRQPAIDPLPALSPAQRTKLLWHRRMNHTNFDQLTAWMRADLIPASPAVMNAPNPVCAACNYGKAQRRTRYASTGVIGAQHDSPGAGMSADQLEAGFPGLIPTTKGSPAKQRYHYCNVWVDHYSRFVYTTMHTSKDAKEMLASKKEFEAFCLRHGVSVKSGRADNVVYASQLFRAHCDSQAQDLTFCAVGGHWQNGNAERCIGMLQNVARTILLQAMSQWPSVVTESFWPFAIWHAVNVYNHIVKIGTTASPWELFTGEPSLASSLTSMYLVPLYMSSTSPSKTPLGLSISGRADVGRVYTLVSPPCMLAT